MLKALKELEQYIRENRNLDDIQVLTESSKLAKMKKLISVVFKKENGKLTFDNVHIGDLDHEKIKKFFIEHSDMLNMMLRSCKINKF